MAACSTSWSHTKRTRFIGLVGGGLRVRISVRSRQTFVRVAKQAEIGSVGAALSPALPAILKAKILGANDEGGGDRRNNGDMLGTTDSAQE